MNRRLFAVVTGILLAGPSVASAQVLGRFLSAPEQPSTEVTDFYLDGNQVRFLVEQYQSRRENSRRVVDWRRRYLLEGTLAPGSGERPMKVIGPISSQEKKQSAMSVEAKVEYSADDREANRSAGAVFFNDAGMVVCKRHDPQRRAVTIEHLEIDDGRPVWKLIGDAKPAPGAPYILGSGVQIESRSFYVGAERGAKQTDEDVFFRRGTGPIGIYNPATGEAINDPWLVETLEGIRKLDDAGNGWVTVTENRNFVVVQIEARWRRSFKDDLIEHFTFAGKRYERPEYGGIVFRRTGEPEVLTRERAEGRFYSLHGRLVALRSEGMRQSLVDIETNKALHEVELPPEAETSGYMRIQVDSDRNRIVFLQEAYSSTVRITIWDLGSGSVSTSTFSKDQQYPTSTAK